MEIKAAMSKREFEATEDGELGAACFAPIVPLIRAKSAQAKQDVYRELTRGQQGLFMFHVYVDHAKYSAEQFYWWTAHYAAQPDAWTELREGLNAFGAVALAELLEETKAALKHPIGDVAPGDLDKDEALSESIHTLYSAFLRSASDAAARIGRAIRSNPTDFVEFLG
jgi:hypothetical protein